MEKKKKSRIAEQNDKKKPDKNADSLKDIFDIALEKAKQIREKYNIDERKISDPKITISP